MIFDYRIGYLIVLALIYTEMELSRNIDYDDDDDNADKISIKAATGISTTEYSILSGYAFTAFYVFTMFILGPAADVYNRRNLIFYGIVIWNFGMILMAIATDFSHLLLSRIILGIGQAFFPPAAYSILADLYKAQNIGQATATLTFGVYIGIGLASASTPVDEILGWRECTYLIAGIGFLLGLILITFIKEPERRVHKDVPIRILPKEEKKSWIDDENYKFLADIKFSIYEVWQLIAKSNILPFIYIAGGIRYMGGYVLLNWVALFYDDIYPDDSTNFAYINAGIIIFLGTSGMFYSGTLADKWELSGNNAARLLLPAITSISGMPFIILMFFYPSFFPSVVFYGIQFFFTEGWMGVVISFLLLSLPPHVRGITIAYFNACNQFFGSLCSFIVGELIDYLTDDETKALYNMKWVLCIAVCFSYFVSAILLNYTSTSFRNVKSSKEETKPFLSFVDDDYEEI